MFSNFSHWWHRPTRTDRRTPSTQPRLEVLEDRISPALYVTVFGADSATNTLTLRGAVNHAKSGDTIILINVYLGQTATLTQGEIPIFQNNLTIESLSASEPATISGGFNSRIFDIAPGASLTLKDVNLVNGIGTTGPGDETEYYGEGGAIYNDGSLTTNGCVFTNNSAAYDGGAIFNAGGGEGVSLDASGGPDKLQPPIGVVVKPPASPAQTPSNVVVVLGSGTSGAVAVLKQTTFSGNYATDSYEGFGGALFNGSGGEGAGTGASMTITGCTLTGNYVAGAYLGEGGAIYNAAGGEGGGGMTITGTTLSSNYATSSGEAYGYGYAEGGAIANEGSLSVTGGTMSKNYATTNYYAIGGAIYNDGTATISGGTKLTGNYVSASGYNDPSIEQTYSFAYGGAIYNDETLTVTGITLSGNSATGVANAYVNEEYDFNYTGGHGGGIANFGGATVSGSNVTGNSANTDGGGIWNYTYASLTIEAGSSVTKNIAPHGTDLEDLSHDAVITGSTVTLINN